MQLSVQNCVCRKILEYILLKTVLKTKESHLAPTKSCSRPSPDVAMLFAPSRCTHPPPVLLMQNQSLKAIAGCDNKSHDA